MAPVPDGWPTEDELLQHEAELVLPGLDEQAAYDLGRRATDAAWAEQLPVVVAVWRGEHQLFHSALPGSTRDNDEWVRRKGRVVLHFERSSLALSRLCREGDTTLEARFALPATTHAAAGGAFPLRVAGAGVVGWFGVSGLPQVEDHAFVVRVLREHLTALDATASTG